MKIVKKKTKSQKITFLPKKYNILAKKIPLRFSELGIQDSTRALQSSQILRFFLNSKNLKNHIFFKKSDNFENIFFAKKNAISLVLLIEEISLQPELSSQFPFRIQGAWSEHYARTKILVSNIGYMANFIFKMFGFILQLFYLTSTALNKRNV